MTQLLIFNVVNGLIIGAFYALMALGLSLILNLSGVINFAHGGFLAIGGYIAYTLVPYFGFWGALVLAPILTAFIGILIERVLIRRLYGRDPLYSLLLTFGLAYMLEDGTRFIWGPESLPFEVQGLEHLLRQILAEALAVHFHHALVFTLKIGIDNGFPVDHGDPLRPLTPTHGTEIKNKDDNDDPQDELHEPVPGVSSHEVEHSIFPRM